MTFPAIFQRDRLLALMAVTAMLVGLIFLVIFDPSSESFFPVCPLYATTGLACAGCGLTRATHAILHGDFSSALRFNILSPFVIGLLGYTWISLASFVARGKSLSFRFLQGRMSSVIILVLISFSILRNLPLFPFNLLFPTQ